MKKLFITMLIAIASLNVFGYTGEVELMSDNYIFIEDIPYAIILSVDSFNYTNICIYDTPENRDYFYPIYHYDEDNDSYIIGSSFDSKYNYDIFHNIFDEDYKLMIKLDECEINNDIYYIIVHNIYNITWSDINPQVWGYPFNTLNLNRTTKTLYNNKIIIYDLITNSYYLSNGQKIGTDIVKSMF